MSKGLCQSCLKRDVSCPTYASDNTIVEQCVEYAPSESHDPEHYKGQIETIDAIKVALGKDGFSAYCRGQVMRYMWRLGKKDAAHKEAKKALVYSQWLYDNLTDMPLTKGIS